MADKRKPGQITQRRTGGKVGRGEGALFVFVGIFLILRSRVFWIIIGVILAVFVFWFVVKYLINKPEHKEPT